MSGSEPTVTTPWPSSTLTVLPAEDVADMLGVSMEELNAMLRVIREQAPQSGDEALLEALERKP